MADMTLTEATVAIRALQASVLALQTLVAGNHNTLTLQMKQLDTLRDGELSDLKSRVDNLFAIIDEMQGA